VSGFDSNRAFVQAGVFYDNDGADHPFVEAAYPTYPIDEPSWSDKTTIEVNEGSPPHVDVKFVGEPAPFPHASSGRFAINVGSLVTSASTCGWVPNDKRSRYERYEGGRPSAQHPKVEIEIHLNGECLWKFYMPPGWASSFYWANLAAERHTVKAKVPGTYVKPTAFTHTVLSTLDGSTYFVPRYQPEDPLPNASPFFIDVPGTCELHSPHNGPAWAWYLWAKNDRGECNPWAD
jgi:hypothetical protein